MRIIIFLIEVQKDTLFKDFWELELTSVVAKSSRFFYLPIIDQQSLPTFISVDLLYHQFEHFPVNHKSTQVSYENKAL